MYFAAGIGQDAAKYREKFGFTLFTKNDKKNIDTAKELGFEGIELFTARPYEDLTELAAYCKSQNIILSNVGTILLSCAYGVNLVHDDPMNCAEAKKMLESMTLNAGKAGAPVSVGGFRGRLGSRTRAQYFDLLHSAMKDSLAIAEDYGTYISLEAISGKYVDWGFTAADIMEFMEYCGSPETLKVHYDVEHGHLTETDQAEAIRSMGAEKLGHLHFTDHDRLYPGHGEIDFKSILRALRDIGYQRQIAFEYIPSPDPVTAAKLGLDYCKKLLMELDAE